MDAILSLLSTGPALKGVKASAAVTTSTQSTSPLASLPQGSIVQGFVLNRDANGNPILRTELGDLLIESKFFFKIGSDVVARVDTRGADVRASILSVDGKAPLTAERTPAHATDADVITTRGEANARQSGNPAANNATGGNARNPAVAATGRDATVVQNLLTGTVVKPPVTTGSAPATSPAANLPVLPTGSQVTVRIVNFSATPTGNAANAAVTTTTATTTTTANPPSTPQTPATITPPTVGRPATLAASTANVTTATTPTPNAAALAGRIVTAQALPPVQPGTTLLSTPFGQLQLQGAPGFPAGANLSIEVRNVQTAPPGNPATAVSGNVPLPQQIYSLGQQWNSVSQIVQQLAQLDEKAATEFLHAAIPAHATGGAPPNWASLFPTAQNMNAGLFVFMTALKGGDFRQWLGEKNAQTLERAGHGELLQRAGSEFSVMRSLFVDAAPGQWQALFLPMLADGEIQPVRYFMKKHKRAKSEDNEAETETRFVVELELSQLGELQLDGLVRKRESGTQFELIVRSHSAFESNVEADIRAIFTTIGEATGYQGAVSFAQESEFHLNPLEELVSAAQKGLLA